MTRFVKISRFFAKISKVSLSHKKSLSQTIMGFNWNAYVFVAFGIEIKYPKYLIRFAKRMTHYDPKDDAKKDVVAKKPEL